MWPNEAVTRTVNLTVSLYTGVKMPAEALCDPDLECTDVTDTDMGVLLMAVTAGVEVWPWHSLN